MKRSFIKSGLSLFWCMCPIVLSLTAFVPLTHGEQINHGMPVNINPSAEYLIFLHNYYVEKHGPDGDCKYHDILKAFEQKGFTVISEVRSGQMVPCTYAERIASQVKTLLDAGVPPANIVVAGQSKGGVIALCVASQLQNPEINFVVMAGCGIQPLAEAYPDPAELKGRFLSIYASSDKVAGSCDKVFSVSPEGLSSTEIKVESDKGHQLFFVPENTWLNPVSNWIEKD